MNINEKIFRTIEEKNLKQADLARILNVRTSVITTWKTRKTNPPIEYAAQICEFLDITIYELLGIKAENEIENIYKKLSKEDKQIVDIIFKKYKIEDNALSSTSKIG